MKTYFITGGAGFIGSSLSERLLKEGNKIITIDNFCDFYDPKLKENNINNMIENNNFKIYRGDIRDNKILETILPLSSSLFLWVVTGIFIPPCYVRIITNYMYILYNLKSF